MSNVKITDMQKKWLGLPEPTFCNGKKKLRIWDFDGTFYNSPDRAEGEVLYLEATGKEWPFAGWWGRIETLLPPIIPDPPPRERLILWTYEQYLQAKADPDAHNVLLTGRPYKNRQRVQAILAHFEISFDEEYYRGMRGLDGHDTFEIKCGIIEGRLVHSRLEEIDLWEDRPEHTGPFTAFLGRLKSKYRNTLRRAAVHDVPNQAHYEV